MSESWQCLNVLVLAKQISIFLPPTS